MKRSASLKMKSAEQKETTRNFEAEARRYIEGVAALLIADSRAGPLLAGGENEDGPEERVAEVLRSLLADRDAWPNKARALREHIISDLDNLTTVLISKLEAGVGLKRKAAGAKKSAARPAKKAKTSGVVEGDEEEEEEEEDSFLALALGDFEAALKQPMDEQKRTSLYTQLLLAPLTSRRALPVFITQERLKLADCLQRLQALTFAGSGDQETCVGLRLCASITTATYDALRREGAHDDAKLAVLRQLTGYMASCEARRRLASHPATAPPDQTATRRSSMQQQQRRRRRSNKTGGWTRDYYEALGQLFHAYIRVASLLSSEFAVRKAYPDLLFNVTLASEDNTHLALALLHALYKLTNNNINNDNDKGEHHHDGDDEDEEEDQNSSSQTTQEETERLRVVAHRLFFDVFVSEERVLRGSRRLADPRRAAVGVQQVLALDPPVHYVRFALVARRSVDFWTGRKEARLARLREEQLKLRKRKDVLASRPVDGGGDLEEMRMLEATVDAGYKVGLPPSLRTMLAQRHIATEGPRQFHFRSVPEALLLEVMGQARAWRAPADRHHDDDDEEEVEVENEEEEEDNEGQTNKSENAQEGDEEEEEEEEGGASSSMFVIDTKPSNKSSSSGGLKGAKDSSSPPALDEKAEKARQVQREVASLVEQMSDDEEEEQAEDDENDENDEEDEEVEA